MTYDPRNHHRRSIRLPEWDYRQAGAYFVTIVTQGRECLFENLLLKQMVEMQWKAIPEHVEHATLDAWIVMPNHLHGILILNSHVEAHATAGRAGRLVPGSLGAIVGNFKSMSAKRINAIRHTPGMDVWQRNYYEHIIRNERDMQAVRQYILDNPAHWAADSENPWL